MSETPEHVSVPVEELVGLQHTAEGLAGQVREILSEGVVGDLPAAPSRGDMSPGEALMYYRNRADMTQAELSDRSGVATNTIINFENGKSRPRIRTLMKWGSVLGVPWQLFHHEEGVHGK